MSKRAKHWAIGICLGFGVWVLGFRVRQGMTKEEVKPEAGREQDGEAVVCPVCGAVAVQEKCKMICRSDVCRGRVVMNCSEF